MPKKGFASITVKKKYKKKVTNYYRSLLLQDELIGLKKK